MAVLSCHTKFGRMSKSPGLWRLKGFRIFTLHVSKSLASRWLIRLHTSSSEVSSAAHGAKSPRG